MKRIEAIIPHEKTTELNEALKEAGVGGCTILEAKGRGKGEKAVVESGRNRSVCIRILSEIKFCHNCW